MELKFKINKYYLLAHTIKSSTPPFDGWIELPNKLWNISNDAYWFLFNPSAQDKIFAKLDDTGFDVFFVKFKKDFEKILSAAFKSKEFSRLHEETKKYLNFLEKEWISKQKIIIATTEEILGEKLPDMSITVLVTHPKLANGMALPESNTIYWGHRENWKNYSMVYLMHEALHLILDRKLEKKHLTHAIIELISDNELRIRLNGKGKYFKEQEEYIGHLFLRKLVRALLPFWKIYLRDRNKNIIKFYHELNVNLEIKKLLEHLSEELNPT